jgi:predicted transcriptional regulator
MDTNEANNTVGLVADIVSAYVSNNSLPAAELSMLIAEVHAVVAKLSKDPPENTPSDPPKPAVPIKKSITEEYLICLEDGRKFKSLKRHLRTRYNMTPEQYRAKWQLPPDYPMVAPGYAQTRSRMAKDMGLGQQRRIKPKR